MKYLTIEKDMPIYIGVIIISVSSLICFYLGALILRKGQKKTLLILILGSAASYYLLAKTQIFFAEFMIGMPKNLMQKLLNYDIYFSFENIYFNFLMISSSICWFIFDNYLSSTNKDEKLIDELAEEPRKN